MSYATVSKSKPQTALDRIMQQSTRRLSAPEPGPGNPFDDTSSHQTEESFLMTHPDMPDAVLGEGKDDAVRYGCNGNKPARLQEGNPVLRPDPHLSAMVLKEGPRLIRQPTVGDLPNRAWRTSAHAIQASIAVHRDLAVIPSIQPVRRAQPKAAIPRRQNGKNPSTRQTLRFRKRWDGDFAKPVQAFRGRHPDTAFPILKNRGHRPA